MTRDDADLPVVEPPGTPPGTVSGGSPASRASATVAGVLLAAGTSTRFGDENKLLADLDGEPMVRRAARTLVASAADPVVVVVGHQADRVRAAVGDFDVTVVENPDYADGQATSVRAGVLAARERGADAALFALGDMPGVEPASVDALVAAYRAGEASALAAACDGRRGNPVLFDRRFFDALADADGDVGGRGVLLGSDDAALVETGDPGVLADVDTREDLGDVRESG